MGLEVMMLNGYYTFSKHKLITQNWGKLTTL